MLDFLKFGRRQAAPAPAAKPAPRLSRLGHGIRSLFASANTDRLSESWGNTPLSADHVIARNQRTLVARSREQAANNDHAKAFLRICQQNIIGPAGITLQAQTKNRSGKLDTAANEAIEWGFFEWSKAENCDVTGKRSFRAIQSSVVRTAAKDGEFFVRMVWGSDGGPWGFALQTLDPQRCPVDLNEDNPRSGGAFIRQGIEFNQYGRPLAYYFSSANERGPDVYQYGGREYVRIPAEQIIHGFREEMEGQKRGLPWMATSLVRMRHLGGFEDSAVVNARVGAAKMGFIQWEDDYGPAPEDESDPVGHITADPGEFVTLPTGARVQPWAQQYPAGEFMPVTEHLLRGIASGGGVTYAELTGDLRSVNFSSIRQGTLDSREHWKECQEWLIETLHARVFAAWLPRALLSQRLKAKGKPLAPQRIDQFSLVAWQGRRWQWIDPRADVDAAVSSKNNFLASPGQIIREQGKDPLQVWTETARDMAMQRDALVAEGFDQKQAVELVMLAMGRQPEKAAPAAAEKKPKEENAAA